MNSWRQVEGFICVREYSNEKCPDCGCPMGHKGALVTPRVQVRIHLSHDRPIEAERELRGLAGFEPYRQGTDPTLLWDFVRRADADLFVVNAKLVPGVRTVQET